MTKDELQKQVLEALSTGKLHPTTIIMGDNVQNKIEKVESGGVVNISGGQMDEQSESEPVQDEPIPADQLFKYIHVAVTNEKEREQIHKTICNIVLLPKMPQICDELYKLMKNHKVLCSINPDAMLKELRRLGLPSEDQEGFSNKNFQYYYKVPKPD